MFHLYLLTFFLSLLCPLFSLSAQDLLKSSDVHRIMTQLLSQHVTTHEMSGKIIQSAIANYITQFDPDHLYLLESEITPFLHLTPSQQAAAINQYEHDQYSIFKQLDQLFAKAIQRSRLLRNEIEGRDKTELFHYTTLQVIPDTYAKDSEELKKRLQAHLINYIVAQKERFGSAMTAQVKQRLIQTYESAFKAVEAQYLYQNIQGEPLTKEEKENLFTIHVLKSLASGLDSHTSFYRDSEAYDLRMRLQKEFQGIGLIFKESSNGVKVAKILPSGPADRSGEVKEGDFLVEIDGKPIKDLTFDEVTERLHGIKGKSVDLVFNRVKRDGTTLTYPISLKREIVTLKGDRVDLFSEPYGHGIIGRIVLHGFYQGDGVSSENDVREAIETLKKKGPLLGLILDLRDNSGGFVSQAVKVAGLFITNGVIVISKYSNGSERFYRDVDGRRAYDGPLIVLTSKATASAAEIVAQALQDYGVALVVGDEHTYGKGTIQTQTVTDNQSSSYFKVTVGKYYTVSGKTPQKEGVKADVIVPSHWSREAIGEENMSDVIENDHISPAYEDKFEDIPADMRDWYLKYYTPTVQHRVSFWRDFLPVLKKNSDYRIAHNKNYQFYLKGGVDHVSQMDEEGSLTGEGQKKQYGEDDLQMEETLNILKDMILLQQEEKQKSVKKVA